MTIENIVAGYTYNFMAFDDYLAIVFKNELDEDNCYHNLINFDEVEFIRRWKSDTCILDVVKRRQKISFPVAKEIEELARCFEGARVSHNDDGTLYISFNISCDRVAFKKIVDLFYPGKYKTEDIADWNFGVRVSDNG